MVVRAARQAGQGTTVRGKGYKGRRKGHDRYEGYKKVEWARQIRKEEWLGGQVEWARQIGEEGLARQVGEVERTRYDRCRRHEC